MKDVIEMLLQKKANLTADCEAEKALALEEIDAKYAERSGKIDALLDLAGYVPPVVAVEEEADGEAVETVAAVEESVAESVPASGQVVY